jgi:hypothetical protein
VSASAERLGSSVGAYAGEQPGFADTGLADHADDPRPTVPGLREGIGQPVQLGLAPNERRQAPRYRHLQTGAQGTGAQHLVDRNRFGDALDRDGAQRPELEIVLDQAMGDLADDGAAGGGEPLHAGRQMNRPADRIVFRPQVVGTHRAHQDFSSMDADTNPQRHGRLQIQPFSVALHRLLHAQGGIDCTLGMVLVGDRCTEQGQNAVAE